MNRFKIYRSSAGSGKTYTLVKEYLRLVLGKPEDFGHILALTFTNKATEEMKTRIVESLIQLSKGENAGLLETLQDELPETNITGNAQRALDRILHDYGNFSVFTIDSFFNRIIRALAREIQLPLRMDIQLDQDEVIHEITSRLFDELTSDKELSAWLTDFAIQKLNDDKGWKIENEIGSIAREIFKEKEADRKPHERSEIKKLLNQLRAVKSGFEKQMKILGDSGLALMESHGVSVDDFSYSKSGVAGYFQKIQAGNGTEKFKAGSRVLSGLESVESWYPKGSMKRDVLIPLVTNHLQPLLREAVSFYEDGYPEYLGATEVLKRIYLLGIVEDLKKKLSEYREENNLLLISDTPKILSTVISDEETPFVYEKSGNRYRHFLIDEFQDTSKLQWMNLLPLVINSLGEGHFAMVVGDVKQSIYRWRGGDMTLLQSGVKKDLANFHSLITESDLDTNYRSKKNIVDFNNAFFEQVPFVINRGLEIAHDNPLHHAYSENANQKVSGNNLEGGHVEIHWLKGPENDSKKNGWKQEALTQMLEKIKDAVSRGHKYGDMAILARNNKEGDEVASFLIENGITQLVSPDSLLLSRSPHIRFLLNIFRLLENHQNQVARGEILYYYAVDHAKDTEVHKIFSASRVKKTAVPPPSAPLLFDTDSLNDNLFNRILPPEFTSRLSGLAKTSLFELCELLIRIFKMPRQDAYLLRFLDYVLEFTGKHNASVRSFLGWWQETRADEKISVVTSGTGNSIRIMSIHKSKGLQFPVVILPFADWKLLPDARDILWIESRIEPYAGFGKIPVSPNKAMEISCFRDSYTEEVLQAITDNVNLLYVAFTRAEEELYIFTGDGDSKELNSVQKLISQIVQSNPDWNTPYETEKVLMIGDLSGSRKTKKTKASSVFDLKSYSHMNWQDKIRLNLKSDELIELFDSPVKQAINYGVLVHRVLSSIKSISETDRVVEQFHSEGVIDEEIKEKLLDEIHKLLGSNEIARFFSEEYQVMNEHEIILPTGETLRPDRVLILGNKAIVIDFKTGKPHASHHKQLEIYAGTLIQMGFHPVEKYLIYLAEKKLERVN